MGIAVPDLDAAVAFYRDTFGFVSVHEEVNEDQGVREAMLAVGDGATRLQLLAPLSPDSPIAAFLDRKGPGIQQIAYTVDDIEAASAALARARPAPAVRRARAERPEAGSTSSIRRTPAACWSNWSSPPPTHSIRALVNPRPDGRDPRRDPVRPSRVASRLRPRVLPAVSSCAPTRSACSKGWRPGTRIRARACTCRKCPPPSWARAKRSSR